MNNKDHALDTTGVDGLTDGQIYRWAWIDADYGVYGASRDPYWCRSRIAIVRGGRLIDTYWSGGGLDHSVDPAKVTLTLIGDEAWPQISESQTCLYDAADVVDTRHSNNSRGPIYLRPGAQRSKAVILETLAHREEAANSDIRSAERRKERINEARKLLAEGRIDEVML